MRISETDVIEISKKLDFIPFVSTASNLVWLVAKVALEIIIKLSGKDEEKILRSSLLWRYIKTDKSYFVIVFLMVPGANVGMAYFVLQDDRKELLRSAACQKQVDEFVDCSRKFRAHWQTAMQQPAWQAEEPNEFYAELDTFRAEIDDIHEKLKHKSRSPSLEWASAYHLMRDINTLKPIREIRTSLSAEKQCRKFTKSHFAAFIRKRCTEEKQAFAKQSALFLARLNKIEAYLPQNSKPAAP